jgi:hypothetical protein
LYFPLEVELIVGGFLMARYRRGVNDAKVYPVVEQGGYMAVSQPGPQTTAPIQPFPQQSGITEPAKK